MPNTPYDRGFNYPNVPSWFTMPGGMRAAEIAFGEMRSHRLPKPVQDKRKKSKEDAGIPTQPGKWWDAVSKSFKPIQKEPLVIQIVDIDMTPTSFKSHGEGFSKIDLYTVPRELEWGVASNWATIASIGRNNPFYHYTGSEDTLAFTIDWYSRQENRQDVIFYCKWLSARAKANGYFEDPHRLILVWGKEDLLFKDDIWILEKASYKLSGFQKQARMLPNQAFQDLVFKKVTPNQTDYDQVLGSIFPNQVDLVSGDVSSVEFNNYT